MAKVSLQEEFLRLITTQQKLIPSLCSLYFSQSEDLKDMFQEIVLQLWKSFPSFKHQSKESTWIYRIALNTIFTKLRKDKSAGARLLGVGSPPFGEALAASPFPLPIDDDEPMAMLAEEGAWHAAFRFADLARPEARHVMDALRDRGLCLVLLSGDRAPVVDRVAEALGVADRVSGASPEDKARHVEALAAKGAVVAMVGDGINDAPVLARAQVSLALAGGSALAQSQEDLVVAHPSHEAVVAALDLARRTRRIIRQNVAWSIAYNLVMLPLALAGILTPWIAAVGISISSLIVVGNALRLVRGAPAVLPAPPRPAA